MLSNQTLTFAEKASSDQIDIIKTLVTILGSALTTMIGFYFGTKAAEKKSDGTTPPSSGEANGTGMVKLTGTATETLPQAKGSPNGNGKGKGHGHEDG